MGIMSYFNECKTSFESEFSSENENSYHKKNDYVNELKLNKLKMFNIGIKGGSSPGVLNTISDITMNEGETITYQLPEFTDYVTHPDLSDNVLQATSADGDLSGNYYLDLSLNDLSDNYNLTDLSLDDLSLNELSLNNLSDNIFFDKDFLTAEGDKLYYSATDADGNDVNLSTWITFINGTFIFNPNSAQVGTNTITVKVVDSKSKSTTTKLNVFVKKKKSKKNQK